MDEHVICVVLTDQKIAWPVVLTISVPVMNLGVSRQYLAENTFDYEAMLRNRTVDLSMGVQRLPLLHVASGAPTATGPMAIEVAPHLVAIDESHRLPLHMPYPSIRLRGEWGPAPAPAPA
jgi:hypothetical protein